MDPVPFRSAAEELLHQERLAVPVPSDAHTRIKQRMLRSISAPEILHDARKAVTPPVSASSRVWSQVTQRIAPKERLFGSVREWLKPSTDTREVLWSRILARLQQEPVTHARFPRLLQWSAIAAAMLIVVRLSPLLFLAPRSIAESPVLLLPVEGETSVLIGGLWQPVTKQIQLQKSALIKTGKNSKATVVLYDDAVIRMDADATIAINELVDRPNTPKSDPSITLYDGDIWFQSFVPAPVTGFTIATAQGDVYVNEGSISLSQADDLKVRLEVLDQSAKFFTDERMIAVEAGNSVEPRQGRVLYQIPLADSVYASAWVDSNLKLDAVHRREIDDMQQKRRAASAGILPTSPVAYAAKRVAETVDVLLTFDSKARTEKILAHAETRFNEAAALIQQNDSGATLALQEFKNTVIDVATGSGDSVTKTLALKTLADASADVSASQPDDQGYLLKEAVREASAEVQAATPVTIVTEDTSILDEIAAVKQSIESGDLDIASDQFAKLQSELDRNSDELSALSVDVRKEAEISLFNMSMTLGASSSSSVSSSSESSEVALPFRLNQMVLSGEQLDAFVQRMMRRVDIYEQERSRLNQLLHEMEGIRGHPQRVSILRRLMHIVSDTDSRLKHFVDLELDSLKQTAL